MKSKKTKLPRSRKALRIWLVVFTGNSGLTHYSYCLARALHERGVDVSLITNGNYELDFMPTGFPVVKIFRRSRRLPLDIIRYWRLFRRQPPDIVHYQSWLKFPAIEPVLLELQKRAGAGVICTAHDWLPHQRRFYHKALVGRYYRTCDRVIVHSEEGRRFLEGQLSVKESRLDVIPHGDYGFFATDDSLGREAARERLGLDPDRFWFLFFGRIDPHKGLETALRSLALLKPGPGEAQGGGSAEAAAPGLVIAGNPGTGGLEEYRRMVSELGLEDRVRIFPGHIPVIDVQLYFRAADAVVLPYRESSTSGIAHLAMGFGLPVVATRVGGLADVVEDGTTGILVPPSDEPALAGAMEKISGDEDTRRRLAEGWASSRERYSWERIAGQTIAVYESLYESLNESLNKALYEAGIE
ncbi:MAG: glycosyltransferase family 4 protein [Actinobacteria bacterium]|nr:glycosyltransferase family 4 protein [Actinomycetota bacterium]